MSNTKAARIACGDVFAPKVAPDTIRKLTLSHPECEVHREVLVDISRPVCDIIDELTVILGVRPNPRTIMSTRCSYVGRAAFHYLHDNLIDGTDLQFAEFITPNNELWLEVVPQTGWRFRIDVAEVTDSDADFTADYGDVLTVVEHAGTVIAGLTPQLYQITLSAVRGMPIPPQFEHVIDPEVLASRPDPHVDISKFAAVRRVGLRWGAMPALDVVLRDDARYTALITLLDFLNRKGNVPLQDGHLTEDVVTELVEGDSFLTFHLNAQHIRRAAYEPALAAAIVIATDAGVASVSGSSLYLTETGAMLLDAPKLQRILAAAALTLKWLVDHDALDSIDTEDGHPPVVRSFAEPEVRTTFSARATETIDELPTFVSQARDAHAHPLQASMTYLPGEATPVQSSYLVPHVTFRAVLEGVEPAITRVLSLPMQMPLDQAGEAIIGLFGWENNHSWVFDVGEHDGWPVRVVTAREQVHGPYCYRADQLQLSHVLVASGPSIELVYDPGDAWVMRLEPIRVEERPSGFYVVEATRACPPEDCGGVAGFKRIQAIAEDPAGYLQSHEQEDPALVASIAKRFAEHDFQQPQLEPGRYEIS